MVSQSDGVKFVAALRERMGLKRYSFAKLLGIPTQQLDYIEDDAQGIKLAVLCKIRKITKLSWVEMGKMLDEEFLGKDKI